MTGVEKVLSHPVSDEEIRYCITGDEIKYFWGIADRDLSRAIFYAFRYGFEKGRRCERAAQKRTKKAPVPPTKETTDANNTTENGCQSQHTTKTDKRQGGVG